MTSDNERAVEALDEIAKLPDTLMLRGLTFEDRFFKHIETIRTALQRDDSVVEEMARALEQYELAISEAANDYVKVSQVAKQNGLMATWREAEETAAYLFAMLAARKSALEKFNASRGKK